jgi:hypothetical protein
MRKNRLFGLSLSVYAALGTALITTPTIADEHDDQFAALNKRIAVLEAQEKVSQLEDKIAQAQIKAASALATAASTDSATISGNKSKEASSDATAKYADVTALKTVLGDTKGIGVDGTISFNASDAAVLLQSRQGGILAAREAADELCAAFKANKGLQNGLTGKPVVPISEQRLESIITAKLRTLRFNEVYSAVEEASLRPVSITGGVEPRPTPGSGKPPLIDDLFGADAKTYSAPMVIAGLAQAQHIVTAVDNLAGVARINKVYSLKTTAREDLFESRLSTCSGIMDASSLKRRADRERLNISLATYYKKLQKMQAFSATVATERRDFDALPKAKQKAVTNNAIKGREALAALVAAISATDDTVASDLALASMESAITDKPILTYSLAIQDTQIQKDRFLLNDKLTYQGTAEVVYQVTGADGAILDGDAISVTSKAYDVANTFSVKALANGGSSD